MRPLKPGAQARKNWKTNRGVFVSKGRHIRVKIKVLFHTPVDAVVMLRVGLRSRFTGRAPGETS